MRKMFFWKNLRAKWVFRIQANTNDICDLLRRLFTRCCVRQNPCNTLCGQSRRRSLSLSLSRTIHNGARRRPIIEGISSIQQMTISFWVFIQREWGNWWSRVLHKAPRIVNHPSIHEDSTVFCHIVLQPLSTDFSRARLCLMFCLPSSDDERDKSFSF